jgi:hypothetical protein
MLAHGGACRSRDAVPLLLQQHQPAVLSMTPPSALHRPALMLSYVPPINYASL